MVQAFLKENRRKRQELGARIAEANQDWESKATQAPLDMEYDPESDYLWVQFGKQSHTIAITTEQGFVVLVDAKSYEFCALECPLFMERVKSGQFKGAWATLSKTLARLIEKGHHHVYIPPEGELRAFHRDFAKLDLAPV